MVEINFYENQLKDRFEVSVKGHANTAEKGKDIVCASVSILSLTLVQTIKNMEKQDFFINPPKYKVKDGFTYVMCKPKKDCYLSVLNSLLTIKVGFNILSQGFPENVKLITGINA